MDIQLFFDEQFFTGDIVLTPNNLGIDESLKTAVFISLFTDKRAFIDNEPQKGWWADSYADNEGDEIGSKLWLLSREKVMPSVLIKAKAYAQEALTWLKEDGLVKDFTVMVESSRQDALKIRVILHVNENTIEDYTYNIGENNALA